MKLVTFVVSGNERLGICSEPRGILDLGAAAQSLLGRTLPADTERVGGALRSLLALDDGIAALVDMESIRAVAASRLHSEVG